MIIEGTVPHQWKTACITPIPKVPHPTKPSEFRPISANQVLWRSFEEYVITYYIYPALLDPPPAVELWRSVCVPTYRIDYCCNNCDPAHGLQYALHQRVRTRFRLWLFKSVWHCPALGSYEQAGDDATTWQRLQLGARLFHQSIPLHAIRRSFVNRRWHQSQCDTGFRSWTGILRRHSRW